MNQFMSNVIIVSRAASKYFLYPSFVIIIINLIISEEKKYLLKISIRDYAAILGATNLTFKEVIYSHFNSRYIILNDIIW